MSMQTKFKRVKARAQRWGLAQSYAVRAAGIVWGHCPGKQDLLDNLTAPTLLLQEEAVKHIQRIVTIIYVSNGNVVVTHKSAEVPNQKDTVKKTDVLYKT